MLKNRTKLEKIIIVIMSIIACWCIVEVTLLNTYNEPTKYTGENIAIDTSVNVPISNTTVSFTPEQDKVKNIRLIMSQVPSDGTGTVEVVVKNEDLVLFRGTRNCADIAVGDWVDFGVNLTLDRNQSYDIVVNIVNTELLGEGSICGYQNSGETLPHISIGYANNLRIRDKLLVVLFILIIYIIAVFIICKSSIIMHMIKDLYEKACVDYHAPRVFSLVSVLVFFFTIEFSQLVIDSSIKIFLASLIFITAYWCENHVEIIRKMLSDKKNRAIVFVLAVWTSFSLIGSRCFIYPISMNLTIGAVILFCIASLLAVPIVISVVIFLNEHFCGSDNDEKKYPWDLIVLSVVAIVVGAIFYIRAFNPAISSPDTNHCMYYAIKSIRGISDWHPAFYILWLKAILKISPNAISVVIVQYIFFGYVLIRGVSFLHEKGVKKGALYGIILFSVLNCGNMVHFTTIWKDIPYALSIVWLNIVLAILLFGERKRKFYVYLELVISLVWTCFFRQAGVVPFIITCIVLVFVFCKKWKIWLSVAVAVSIALTIKIPIYNYYEIQKDHGGGIYIGLGQDIMGAYYNGGELSEEAVNIVNVLSKTDITNYWYTPYWANSSYALDITKGEFIQAYLDTFIRNPILMTRTIICRMDAVWDIFIGENGTLGCVNYLGTMDGSGLPEDNREFSGRKDNEVYWNDLWGTRENNFITERMAEWTAYSQNRPLLNVIEWRSGIWFWLFLISMGLCIYKRRFKDSILLFVPCLSHVLSLMLSTGWSDFRYFWPINLMSLFVLLTVMTLKEKR